MTTRQRIDLLARAYPRLFPRAELVRLVREQLGHVDALDRWIERDGVRVRARAPKVIYHICAGNLAVSAVTSIAQGVMLGSHNIVKLPGDREDSSTRREILTFIRGLPAQLRKLVETEGRSAVKLPQQGRSQVQLGNEGAQRGSAMELPQQGRSQVQLGNEGAQRGSAVKLPQQGRSQVQLGNEGNEGTVAVIAFGSDATMESIRAKLRFDQKLIAHGHAVSLLWLAEADQITTRDARAIATDVLTYDQLGCLSPQVIYVPPKTDVATLGEKISRALEAHWRGLEKKPARPLGVAARIAEARDMAHALGHRTWQPKHLGWTLMHDPDSFFQPSPLHGVISIRVTGESRLRDVLFSVNGLISTVGVAGKMSAGVEKIFLQLGVTRFCPAGKMQFPPLTWHHDGRAPLADLVTWVDREENF